MVRAEDLPDIARRLVAAANVDRERALRMLRRACPSIARQIVSDARRRGPLSFWGRSSNLDELTESLIVEPAILDLIGELSGRVLSSRQPHAGLQHTYGYLFSLIETPYGPKRDRWIESSIEVGLGLDPSTLGPDPVEGTLLANATWLAGRIAFRGRPAMSERLTAYLRPRVAPELTKLDAEIFDQIRLLETVDVLRQGERRQLSFQTDLIRLPEDRDQTLLVYSVVDLGRETHQLITLFPTGPQLRDEIVERGAHRRRSDIRLRYNAHVPNVSGREFVGACGLSTLEPRQDGR